MKNYTNSQLNQDKLAQEAAICQMCFYWPVICIKEAQSMQLEKDEFADPSLQKWFQLMIDNIDHDNLDGHYVYHLLQDTNDRKKVLDLIRNFSLCDQFMPLTPIFFSNRILLLRKINKSLAMQRLAEEIEYKAADYTKNDEMGQHYAEKLLQVDKAQDIPTHTPASILQEVYNHQVDPANQSLLGFDTGIDRLNAITLGLQKQKLWVIGGYQSRGKSMLACFLSTRALINGSSILYYSLEMPVHEVAARIIASESSVPTAKISFKNVWGHYKKELDAAIEIFKNYKLSIQHDLNSWSTIKANIERHITAGNPPDIIVVDYIQKMAQQGYKDYYDMLRSSIHDMQAVAIQHNLAFIAISQLNREYVKHPGEALGYKGAGDIEEAADVAIMLSYATPDQDDKIVKQITLHVVKNRSGLTGAIPLLLHTDCSRFYPDPNPPKN